MTPENPEEFHISAMMLNEMIKCIRSGERDRSIYMRLIANIGIKGTYGRQRRTTTLIFAENDNHLKQKQIPT